MIFDTVPLSTPDIFFVVVDKALTLSNVCFSKSSFLVFTPDDS